VDGLLISKKSYYQSLIKLVINELLNVEYDFASVPVLDFADIVYSIEFLCTE